MRDISTPDDLVVCLHRGRRAYAISVHLVPHAAECVLTVDAEPDRVTARIDWKRLRSRHDHLRARWLARALAHDLRHTVTPVTAPR